MRRLGVLILTVTLLAGCNLPFGPTTYKMSSDSMLPTLRPGDAVVAPSKPCRAAAPSVGDVVVYHPPPMPGLPAFARSDRMNMHRVVAGPGDRIAFKAGRLILNGREVKTIRRAKTFHYDEGVELTVLRELLPGNQTHDILAPSEYGQVNNLAEQTVPAGHWFIAGDNRDNSLDSRTFGPVAQDKICGVATTVLTSQDPERRGKKP